MEGPEGGSEWIVSRWRKVLRQVLDRHGWIVWVARAAALLAAVGAFVHQHTAHPREWFLTASEVLKEAGGLCLVFGFIEYYMGAAKHEKEGEPQKEPPRLGLGGRNLDVVSCAIPSWLFSFCIVPGANASPEHEKLPRQQKNTIERFQASLSMVMSSAPLSHLLFHRGDAYVGNGTQ